MYTIGLQISREIIKDSIAFSSYGSHWSNGQLWQKSATVHPAVWSNQTDKEFYQRLVNMRHFWNTKCPSSSACVHFFPPLGLSYSHNSTSHLFIISINLFLVEKQLYPRNLLNSLFPLFSFCWTLFFGFIIFYIRHAIIFYLLLDP